MVERVIPRTNQVDQIDHDLDHLVPHLPLREVVHTVCKVQTKPWKTCAYETMQIVCTGGPTRQHELDQTRSGTDLPCLADLDHEL